MATCNACNGTGTWHAPGAIFPTTCSKCHGAGTVGGGGPSISSFGGGSHKGSGSGGSGCLLIGLWLTLVVVGLLMLNGGV